MPTKSPRIVIIGLGFLMRHMKPCFTALTGSEYQKNIVGTTATESTIPEKQKEMGFEIVHASYLEVLREIQPNIIMFSPPPSAVGQLTKNVLIPYYSDVRQKMWTIPDVYAFPPDPRVNYYHKSLGSHVFCVNILPNMTFHSGGKYPRCYSVVSYSQDHEIDLSKIYCLKNFLKPLGYTIYIPPNVINTFIGAYVTCHLILNFVFATLDGYQEAGMPMTKEEIAREMQVHLLRKITEKNVTHREFSQSYELLIDSMTEGIFEHYKTHGFVGDLAQETLTVQLNAFLDLVISESRDGLVKKSQGHATKGGLLENAEELFEEKMMEKIKRDIVHNQGLSLKISGEIKDFIMDTCAFISAFSNGYSGIRNY